MKSLKMVDTIIEQKTHDYTDNLRIIKTRLASSMAMIGLKDNQL